MSTGTYSNKRSAPGSNGPAGKPAWQNKNGQRGGYSGGGGQRGGYSGGGGQRGGYNGGGQRGGYSGGGGQRGGYVGAGGHGKPAQRDFRPTKPQPGSFKGKQPQRDTNEAAIRRKRPVTQGGGSEEEVEEDEDMEDDEMEVDQPEGDAAEGTVGENGEPAEKRPKMSKTERAALHAAQPHRTALLPSHPLLHGTLLPLWEKARRADLGKEERKVAVKELWDSAKGRVGEISRGHKGGRVLQTIVKYGGKEERLGVAMELQPQWRDMMESKYSKFLMAKLIRYVPSIRPLLIPAITTHLSTLLAHAHAVQPLSDFFDLWASAKERRLLVRGFYPKEVAIFDGGKGEEGLEGTLEKMGAEGKGRERVLDGVEKTVLDVFNATQKTALAQGLFHRLVLEYVTCIFRFLPAEEAEKKKASLLEAALESLPEIVHTKDGSAVVRLLLVQGNAKDRKQILQHLRKHVEAMCKDADAQLVLFTAFDCVDDTKLMGKAFVSDIVALTSSLASDKNGRRAILYLLTPTSTRHFMPSTLSILSAAAQTARDCGTSKKDPATRRKEIVGYASPGLLEVVAEKGEELVRDPGAGLLVQEIMLHATGDKSKAVEALVAPLRTPYAETPEAVAEDKIETDEADEVDAEAEAEVEDSSSTAHILDLAHATRTYKTLLNGGHFDQKTKTVEVTDAELGQEFAKAVWAAITSGDAGGNENAVKLAQGGAAFVMAELVEALKKAGQGAAVKKVLGGAEVRKGVESNGKKGAGLLAEKLAGL